MYTYHTYNIINDLNIICKYCYTFHADTDTNYESSGKYNIRYKNNWVGNPSVIEIYDNYINFKYNLYGFVNKFVENFDEFIIDLTLKYNIKNYQYHVEGSPYHEIMVTEKYNFPDFNIGIYSENEFHIITKTYKKIGFIKFDGIFRKTYHPLPYMIHDEEIKKYIMVMDGKEDMTIELDHETIHLTKKYEPPFLD